MLTRELRRLGPAFEPRLLEDRGHLRVGQEVLVALLVPVKDHPDPVVVVGIAKDLRTLRAVCFRFSAPLVENVFQKRSKSSTLTVDRIMAFVLLWTSSIELCRREQRADERYSELSCRAGRSR